MKFYLISDNHDTYLGMQLAGIKGVIVPEDGDVKAELRAAMAMEDVGVILITERLVPKCADLVYELKLNVRRPLIVEIPDRHAQGRSKDLLSRYVREAIGVKI